ncbi:MAG: DUF1893 domain-containing protein [Parabacteroides sp.]|nr:DUF1893 domain-containing protein [Parabacteroides sp.]
MNELVEMLRTGNYSCVIRNGSDVRTFTRRGVADLYGLLKEEATFLKGAMLADKVIGKAAAALALLGGVKELYAEVISLSALMLLREAGVEARFRTIVPYIRNRNGDDWCPLERACYKEKDAHAVLSEIESFLLAVSARRTA